MIRVRVTYIDGLHMTVRWTGSGGITCDRCFTIINVPPYRPLACDEVIMPGGGAEYDSGAPTSRE